MGSLSEHFDCSEFACPDCGKCEVSPILLSALEELRSLLGKPIHILSGYRCSEHNKSVGGASASQHVLGQAADIRVVGLSLIELYKKAKQVKAFMRGGIGLYDTGFIHVDVRAGLARWSRVKGKYGPIARLLSNPPL